MHPQAPLDTLVRCGRWLAFFVAGGGGGVELGSLLEVQLVKLYARCCDADCSMRRPERGPYRDREVSIHLEARWYRAAPGFPSRPFLKYDSLRVAA